MTTATTLSFDLPDALRTQEGETVREQDLVVLEIFQPDFAVVASIAISAGDTFGVFHVPNDGPLQARFIQVSDGATSESIDVNGLRDLGDETGTAAVVEVTSRGGTDPAELQLTLRPGRPGEKSRS